MSKVPKGYAMNASVDMDNSHFYDMGARDSKEETGQKFRMSANGGEESGRISHSQRGDTTKGMK